MDSDPKDDLTLFTHRNSPFAQRAHIAVLEKGIQFKPVFVDYSNKPKELLEANPMYATVPTLVHNGTPVAETLIILEYLDEAFPETAPLLPKDAIGRAKRRFWADVIFKGFISMRGTLQAPIGGPENLAAVEMVVKFLKTLEETMTEYSAEGPFFTGEKFGYLDVVLAPFSCWLLGLEKLGGVDIPGLQKELPRFRKWVAAVQAQESVKAVLPTNEEMLEYLPKRLKEKMKAAKA